VVIHLSGSLGLDVLGHPPDGAPSIPWCPCPPPPSGAERLRSGITFAVAGDPITGPMAEALGGRPVDRR
jgi:hypothetical protein